jgi:lysophospholipase L1-like esterase
MAMARHTWAKSLLLALASVLLTLVVLEAGFRVAHVPVGTVQINRATVRRSDDPRLRFELRPGGAARGEVEYRVNALGLRGPETTTEKPAGVRRVAVLGDSIAFGYWVADEQGFARQLEALLNEPAGHTGGRIEVLNFGVPGYNLEQEIDALRTKALVFAPDAVVVLFCLNDLEGLFSYELGLVQERSERRKSALGLVREWLVDRSRLFAWVEYRMTELDARRSYVKAKNPLEGRLYAEAVSEQKKALHGEFAVLRSLLASHAIPGMVVVVPVLGDRFDRYPHRELHQAVVEVAEAESLAGLDLLDCFSAYAFRDLRVDVVHPSPLGHRVAAHAVRDALCERGWLCSSVPPGPSCRDYRPSDFASVRGY